MAQHSLRVRGRLQVVGKPSLSLTMDRPCRTVSAGNGRGRPCAVTASAPAFRRDAASCYWPAAEDAIGDAELAFSKVGCGGRRLDGEIEVHGAVEDKTVGEQKQAKLKAMGCRWCQRQGATGVRHLAQAPPLYVPR